MKLYAMKQDGLWVEWNWTRTRADTETHLIVIKALDNNSPVDGWSPRLNPAALVTLADRRAITSQLKGRGTHMVNAEWHRFDLKAD